MRSSGWKYLFYITDIQDTLESNGIFFGPHVLTAFMAFEEIMISSCKQKRFSFPYQHAEGSLYPGAFTGHSVSHVVVKYSET